MDRFQNKVILIAGGSRGIGAAVARRFSSLGGEIAIGYRTHRDAADVLVSDIEAKSGVAKAFEGDISRANSVETLVQNVIAHFGRIDVLVNCAAVAPYRPLGAIDEALFREIFDANVLGTVLLTQAVVPHLPSPGGRIINFSSRLAFSPIPASSIYAASKAAVITLTQAFSKELGPKGITVNAVAPGVIETDMTTSIIAERGDAIRAATPLGRIGQPEDIAGIVTFLASPDAGWITGRTILADGGMT